MKLIKEHRMIVFSLLMGVGMSFFMSFVMTVVNAGFPPMFFQIWMRSWLVGFFASLIPALGLPPLINKFLDLITKD
ncbi:hypothetical protein BW727_101242 [Jeotgalibaca dankookensis]|uniref:DUF2798 domain-containing protein n=1 Tax=Jeotgalibaca dankookensis TaxID=708126 RepID=A0A1S6IQ15_9LACT|nr:DUF2798 domain-containing protein [Jeotgalibaca dankookensis]AQS53609.1 hypothetical protein BW727_101242 [Jeotgalibaca dankookensis]